MGDAPRSELPGGRRQVLRALCPILVAGVTSLLLSGCGQSQEEAAPRTPFDAITLLRQGDATSLSEVTIGNISHPANHFAITGVGANALEFPATIPENAVLRVDFAVVDRLFKRDFSKVAEPVEFSVEFQPDSGESETLYRKRVDIRGRPQDRIWHRKRLDLSDFAGQRGRLRLVNGDAGPVATAWGRPTLFDGEAEASRPNLIFILVDALRADHLGSEGYPRPTSPHLDALASQSVRYASAFTNAPMTAPSLPQILTSRYVPEIESPTLASMLHAGGMPVTRGISSNPFLTMWLMNRTLDNFDTTFVAERGDAVTKAALDWIDEVAAGDRFALYIHYLDVHSPYNVPAEDAELFIDPDYEGSIGLEFNDHGGAAAGHYVGADRQRITDLYDGSIHYEDRQIGDLLDGLRARGLFDSSMLVLTSDHGEELWDHGSFFHGQSLYDEQLHVPLLIRLPGGEGAGTTVTEMVRTLDLLPTIADTLRLPHREGWEGSSLVDTGGRPKDLEDRDVLARAANPGKPLRTAVRTREYKLIVDQADGNEELFHLISDPDEKLDISESREHAQDLRDMRKRLDRFADSLSANTVQVRARSMDGEAHRIDLQLTNGVPISDPRRVGLRPGDRLELDADLVSIRWTGRVGAEARGFRFTLRAPFSASAKRAPEIVSEELGVVLPLNTPWRVGDVTFEIFVDGDRLPDSAIRLGPGITAQLSAAQPTNEPLAILAALNTDASQAGESAAKFPIVVSIWRAGDQTTTNFIPEEFSDGDRERLRALGYIE